MSLEFFGEPMQSSANFTWISPPGSPTSSDYRTPVAMSQLAPSPVNVENWEFVGRRMAQIFRDRSPSFSPTHEFPGIPGGSPAEQVAAQPSPSRSPNCSPVNHLQGGAFAVQLLCSYGCLN